MDETQERFEAVVWSASRSDIYPDGRARLTLMRKRPNGSEAEVCMVPEPDGAYLPVGYRVLVEAGDPWRIVEVLGREAPVDKRRAIAGRSLDPSVHRFLSADANGYLWPALRPDDVVAELMGGEPTAPGCEARVRWLEPHEKAGWRTVCPACRRVVGHG